MKTLKSIFTFVLFFFISLAVISCDGNDVGPDDNPKPNDPSDAVEITVYNELSASDAIENSKLGWNLGNTLDCYGNVVNPSESWILKKGASPANWETAWGNPEVSQELIHYVKSLGFQGIRIPVTWGEHLDANNTINSEWMARVKQIVEWALKEDFYVILNVHHDTGTKGWLRATKESYDKYNGRYEKIWQQISAEFKDYNEKLMFEGFNEMLDGALGDGETESGGWGGTTAECYGYINKWNQLFVNTVRASGGNNASRNLICNTYSAGSEKEKLDSFTLPNDSAKNHLICEVHNYNVNDSSLDADFLRTAQFAEKVGCPVIIGEWGASTDDSGGESFSYLPADKRAEHAKNYISLATKRGLACYVWDDGGSYQLVDRNKLSLAHEDIVTAIVNNVEKTVPLTDEEK